MATLLLTTVGSTGWKTGVAFAANGLLAIVSLGKQCQRRIIHATPQPQDKMKRGFLLNVVIAQGPSVFQLLAGEDEALLIRGNALLILNLGLDVVDGIGWLDIESDGLARQGLYENLHGE